MSSVKNTLINVVSSFILMPLGIIVSIFVARELGPADKGIYTFLTLIGTTLLPISFFGVSTGNKFYITSNRFRINDVYFSSIFISIIHGCLASALLFILFKNQILGNTGNKINEVLINIIIISIPIQSLYFFINKLLISVSNFKASNFFNILKVIINILCLIMLIFIFDFGLKGAVISILITNIVISLTSFFYCLIIYKPIFKFDYSYLRLSYSYGIKIWMGSIANRANDKLDQVLLSVFSSPSLLGVYSVAYNYSVLLTKPTDGIFSVFFNRTASEKDRESSIILAEQIHRALLIVTVPIAVFLMISSKYLINLLYGEEFLAAFRPALILIPGIFLYRITRRVLQLFLASKGKPFQSSIIQITGALSSLIFYLLLIPSYNIIGAALGTLIGFVLSTIMAYILYQKFLGSEVSTLFKISRSDLIWVLDKFKKMKRKERPN